MSHCFKIDLQHIYESLGASDWWKKRAVHNSFVCLLQVLGKKNSPP